MRAALGKLVSHSPLVEVEGRNNCLYWAAVRQQGQDLRDQRGVILQAIKDRAFALTKGLVTEVTDEAPFLLRMHADVALPALAFGRAIGVGGRILVPRPGAINFLVAHPDYPETPVDFSKNYYSTVACGATKRKEQVYNYQKLRRKDQNLVIR
ncbi:MAG: hypothetical protein JST84_04370 [Acidobacteria bacterium]|nr:hypothetical protein [Acidobacteriota bacterium]